MTIDISRPWPFASKALHRVRIVALAARTALGVTRDAIAQSDLHDLMEGRARGLSFPVSCGADIQPRFDAAAAALHFANRGRDNRYGNGRSLGCKWRRVTPSRGNYSNLMLDQFGSQSR